MTTPKTITFDHTLFAAQMKKQFGDDVLVNLKETPRLGAPGTFTETSCEDLNLALNGGIPHGRVVEILGLEAGGKSTLVCDLSSHVQRNSVFKGRPVWYGDAENAFNPTYFEAMKGDIDPKKFILFQSSIAEEMFDASLMAARAGAALIVVDSVAGLELSGDAEKLSSENPQTGGISKMIRSYLRKMKGVVADTGGIAVYINQITYKFVKYGSPETSPAGTALKYFASLRLDVRAGGTADDKGVDKTTGEVDSVKSHIKVLKSRVSPPFRTADMIINFGRGIDFESSLADALIRKLIVTPSSSWIKYGELKWQGRPAFVTALKADPKLTAKLRAELWKE